LDIQTDSSHDLIRHGSCSSVANMFPAHCCMCVLRKPIGRQQVAHFYHFCIALMKLEKALSSCWAPTTSNQSPYFSAQMGWPCLHIPINEWVWLELLKVALWQPFNNSNQRWWRWHVRHS